MTENMPPRMETLSWAALLAILDADLAMRAQGYSSDLVDDTVTARANSGWLEMHRRISDIARIALATMRHDQIEREDLVQDVLLLMQDPVRLHRLSQVEQPGAYLVVLLRNTIRNRVHRSSSRERTLPKAQLALKDDAGEGLSDPDTALFAADVFRRLSAEEMALVRLRFWEDLPLQEIATRTGMSYAAVAQRLSKLIRRLHNDLRDR